MVTTTIAATAAAAAAAAVAATATTTTKTIIAFRFNSIYLHTVHNNNIGSIKATF